MNAVIHGPRRGPRTPDPYDCGARPGQRPEDYPAWREGLLVGVALLALALLQYWHLAFP